MSPAELPTAEKTSAVLKTLLRKNVSAKPSAPLPQGTKVFVGVYTSADGAPRYLWVCDIPLAATLAAALVMLPRAAATDAVAAQALSAEMIDNAHEVANVCGSSFSDRHVRLSSFSCPNTQMSPAITALINHPAKRLDLELQVEGYIAGRLSILSVAA